MSATNLPAFLWSIAEILRGDYKPADYGKVILPFTVLRRLDCALKATKTLALEEHARRTEQKLDPAYFLPRITGYNFFNTSTLDFEKIANDPGEVRQNLMTYINSFSPNVVDIFENFAFEEQIQYLSRKQLLYQVTKLFAQIDLHPDVVSNTDMGHIFEELIRKFAELANDTAGDHFTPREVIHLMVDLLFCEDNDALTRPGTIRRLYDPAAGTGGMLSVAEEHLRSLNPDARLVVFGQELNPESYAICKSDMLLKGQDISNIKDGNTLSEDGHKNEKFDYGLSNPPFGVDWKKIQEVVEQEHASKGFTGRFGPGLPRVSDGSLLFLLHLISKMQPVKMVNGQPEGGGRIAIVLNGSPLFTGGAGSGESEIRKWIIGQEDLLEAIIALPTDMFYNTGISTYIWVLSNHKSGKRKGRVQLINGVDFYQKMRKSLGSKRKELGEADIARIVQTYGAFCENDHAKIFDTADFGYSTITVERPLRLAFQITPESLDALKENRAFAKYLQLDQLIALLRGLPAEKRWLDRKVFLADLTAAFKSEGIVLAAPQWKALIGAFGTHDESAVICLDSKGRPEPNPDLRDTENVPLKEDIQSYFEREVLPHVPDAWIDHEKTRVGYEIPFTRHFYKFQPPRPLAEIDHDLNTVTAEILELLKEVTHEA